MLKAIEVRQNKIALENIRIVWSKSYDDAETKKKRKKEENEEY